MKKNTFCTLMFRRTGEVLKVRFLNYQILGEGAKKLTEGLLATLHSIASFGTLGQNWFLLSYRADTETDPSFRSPCTSPGA